MGYEKSMAGALGLQNSRPGGFADGALRMRAASGNSASANSVSGNSSLMNTALAGGAQFAAHMGIAGVGGQLPAQTSEGQARAQALDTLSRMLENGDGGDALHSLRNSLSNMALANLTRLTQTESGEALLAGAANPVAAPQQAAVQTATVQAAEQTATAQAAGQDPRSRFDIQFVERIRTTGRGAAGPAGKTRQAGQSVSALSAGALRSSPAALKPESTESGNSAQAAQAASAQAASDQTFHAHKLPGRISAQFESGRDGIAAIGYDRTGGTSYGKYQIAAKVGSMDRFVNFLKTEAPDLAERLENAGPADTGGRGGAMPAEWKAIAAEQPERFGYLQEAFIAKSHFEPAMNALAQSTGLSEADMSDAMKEAMWSTAVQHGPSAAARIFSQAISRAAANVTSALTGKGQAPEAQAGEVAGEVVRQAQDSVIREVYSIRATQFGSSTPEVQTAVKSRLNRERDLVLAYAAGANGANVA